MAGYTEGMSLLWINGTLTDKAEVRISPFDHGFLYGDGVWGHLRLFNGKPFRARIITSRFSSRPRKPSELTSRCRKMNYCTQLHQLRRPTTAPKATFG